MKTKLCFNCGKLITRSVTGLCISCFNHSKKGVKKSPETRRKISEAKLSEKNPNWKGEKAGYCALHIWVRKRMPKTSLCECCRKVPPKDLANKGVYNRDLENWEWLCRKCHMIKDGRLFLLATSKKLSYGEKIRRQRERARNLYWKKRDEILAYKREKNRVRKERDKVHGDSS